MIRAGVAILQYIYLAPGTNFAAFRYSTLSSKAVAGVIKPETRPPTKGAAAQLSLRVYLQTRYWMFMQSMLLDLGDFEWMVWIHSFEPVQTLDPPIGTCGATQVHKLSF
jgi:hypothetical protein